ncbi:MAG: hypothetical protein KC466_08940 [Myxococcales bacterium]|nr:hypothetical protein [Myxococcales bacterium]
MYWIALDLPTHFRVFGDPRGSIALVAIPVREAGGLRAALRHRQGVARIVAEGHRPAPDLWEVCVAGPESNPDPATFRTELNRPLLP